MTLMTMDAACLCCLASCLLLSLPHALTLYAGVCPGVVEAWAAGGTWAQVTADSNLDDGDIMRLLNRTSDLLRQARAFLSTPAHLSLVGRHCPTHLRMRLIPSMYLGLGDKDAF